MWVSRFFSQACLAPAIRALSKSISILDCIYMEKFISKQETWNGERSNEFRLYFCRHPIKTKKDIRQMNAANIRSPFQLISHFLFRDPNFINCDLDRVSFLNDNLHSGFEFLLTRWQRIGDQESYGDIFWQFKGQLIITQSLEKLQSTRRSAISPLLRLL